METKKKKQQKIPQRKENRMDMLISYVPQEGTDDWFLPADLFRPPLAISLLRYNIVDNTIDIHILRGCLSLREWNEY
jgi:hypothetical protein